MALSGQDLPVPAAERRRQIFRLAGFFGDDQRCHNPPRALRVMAEKKFSTAFSQDAEVGVKWNRLVFELTMTTGPECYGAEEVIKIEGVARVAGALPGNVAIQGGHTLTAPASKPA